MTGDIEIMASICEDPDEALEWKCCSLPGQNVSVTVKNRSGGAIKVSSVIEFRGGGRAKVVPHFYPHGVQVIEPRDGLSFYCSLDPRELAECQDVVITLEGGVRLSAPVTGASEKAAERPAPGPRLEQ